jgi:predicted Zn-ribbon and HTH transcriptional regulator
MVEKVITSSRNVVDFTRYQQDRAAGKALAMSPRVCRHCGAALAEGEREDECSSALNVEAPRLREVPRKFYAD